MNKVIEKIQASGQVVGKSGGIHQLHSAIDAQEGRFLYDLILKDSSVQKTLEVGCAYGMSSLHICAAIQGRPDAWHTIIDPFQNTQWDGVGLRNLEEAGFNFYDLVELKSEFALPSLLQTEEGQFDLVFVDGWHTFDHALLDCFYATRLLRKGGYLVVDDVSFSSVGRVLDLLRTWPCYAEHTSVVEPVGRSWRKSVLRGLMSPVPSAAWGKLLSHRLHKRIFQDQSQRMVALQKTREDQRNWHWHDESF